MPRLARRLIEPELVAPDFLTRPVWVDTYGPEVAEVNAAIGFAPDPQQALGLDVIFSITAEGLPACFAFGCVSCRQNLKTGLLKQTSIGWLFVTEVPWFVWSAHELSTTIESQRELHAMIADSPFSRLLPSDRYHGLHENNNDRRLELRTGQHIKFKARTQSGGRGLSAPKVILDEAFALKASHVGSLLPTMLAQGGAGQVLYASSAGKSDSRVLRDVRDRGRAGASPRLGYVEWLAPRRDCTDPECKHPKAGSEQRAELKPGEPGYCALDDRELWAKANPTLTTGRIRLETIADLRQELPPEEFARECLGWWDEDTDVAEDVLPGWNAAGDVDLEPPAEVGAIGLAVSFDRRWGSIASAGHLDDGRVFMGASQHRPGSAWLVDEASRIQRITGCKVVVDGHGPAANLIPLLEAAGVNLTIASTDDACAAAADLEDGLANGTHVHAHHDELDDAVPLVVKRNVVDRWTLGRRATGDDISMLEAAMLAAWALNQPDAEASVWFMGDLDAPVLCASCRVELDLDPSVLDDDPGPWLCEACADAVDDPEPDEE